MELAPIISLKGNFESVVHEVSSHLKSALPANLNFKLSHISKIESAPLDKGHWIVPFICESAEEGIVSGICTSDSTLTVAAVESSLRHFQCMQELAESNGFVNEYALQVTNDFEEMVWLRNLAELFEKCDVRKPMEEVASHLLPSLRQILNSDYLELVELVEKNGSIEITRRVSDTKSTQHSFDTSTFFEMIEPDDVTSTHIYNCVSSVRLQNVFPDIQSCLACRIGSKQECFGWLVAVKFHSADRQAAMQKYLGDCEFGTFEAALVRSASTLLQTHGRNLQLIRQKEAIVVGAIQALINSIDAKDPYTFGHSDRVALISRCIASQFKLSDRECEEVYMTGLLHDIGKIGIPDAILLKPSRLTDEEFKIIQQHPTVGHQILSHLDSLSYSFDGVLHHHESYDGTGYPGNLAGEDIPLFGRILAIADAYDAMTSSRPYRDAMPLAKAEAIIRNGAGTQWDPRLVQCFFDALEDIRKCCNTIQPQKINNDKSFITLPVMKSCRTANLNSQPAV